MNFEFLILGQTQNSQCKIQLNDLDLGMNVNTFFVENIVEKMKNILLLIAILLFFTACQNNSSPKAEPTNMKPTTLLVASDGSIFNYNLDKNQISWEYNSPIDSTGNRNFFALDGQNIFMPFESGKFINFDVETGKILWKKQIYGNEDEALAMASGEDAENEYLQARMPLFMTKPLVDNENIVIASTGQPLQTSAWIYSFNRDDGAEKWHGPLPTPYNLFSPVKYRNFYFVNSAIFLEKISAEDGTAYSYGMFDGALEVAGQPIQEYDENQFEHPIYNQMQTDGENLYIGDENGKFYCFYLDKTASLRDGDINDPNNTFIKNPKIFKWTFNDENFDFQSNNITFLDNEILFVEMKNGSATQTCFFALNIKDGKAKWKKIINGDVINWALNKDKIAGNTENTIFYLNTNGENFVEIKIQNKPLSNIEWKDDTHLIYITQNGIEVFDITTKTSKTVFTKSFSDKGNQNYVQIKLISK